MMKDKKYDIFDLALGTFEDTDIDPVEFLEQLTTQVVAESERMYEVYKAEKEIVRSILDKAVESADKGIRSTD